MAGKVIGNDQVAGPQGRREHLLDIDAEAVSVHWPIQQPRRLDAVTAQAPRRVMVFQCPYGTLLRSRAPRGPQPRSGAMLVLVQVCR